MLLSTMMWHSPGTPHQRLNQWGHPNLDFWSSKQWNKWTYLSKVPSLRDFVIATENGLTQQLLGSGGSESWGWLVMSARLLFSMMECSGLR
jgi:hypothetical protein